MTRTASERLRARASRRLRFRSRSVAVSTALVVVALAAAYVGTEAVLALIGAAPLVAAPLGLLDLTADDPALAFTAAGVLAAAGVLCVLSAVLPGRFRRREVGDARAAVVLDDDVLASGLSRSVAASVGVARTQVRTSVGRRRADVRITPTTGFAVAQDAALATARETVQGAGIPRGLTTAVAVERAGVLG